MTFQQFAKSFTFLWVLVVLPGFILWGTPTHLHLAVMLPAVSTVIWGLTGATSWLVRTWRGEVKA